MNGPDDDNEIGFDEFADAYEEHRADLYEMLIAYADEHDLNDGFLAQIISDLGVSLRMVAYASETEKPSVGGLRLDLDRFARELGDTVREAKKGAAEFIEEAKRVRQAEDEAEAEAASAAAEDERPH
ncbi:MAG TPA: hypothetical protein VLA00_05665 [Xanthobacteraceae bacterium]|nr:hypothetical protein [Xanthobacteraceae bacterium]